MNAPTAFELEVLSTTLIVLALVYALVKYLWSQPLQNGPGFFLGNEVPAGFYEGPGRTWLKAYRATLAALHLVLAAALGACIVLRRLDLWYFGTPLLYVTTLLAFHAWTRHKLGSNPPIRPVALALETRRLGDYISWPFEALSATIIAFSWWLLMRHGGTRIEWLPPLLFTWTALVLPGKILIVRSGSPLPAERAEEHYRYQDAMRRNGIDVLSAWSWLFVIFLFGFALRRAWTPARNVPWLQWLILGIFWAFWGYMMFVVFRGQRLAANMGRGLLPSGSWLTPFRRASWTRMSRPYDIWFAIWFGGIMVLSLYSMYAHL